MAPSFKLPLILFISSLFLNASRAHIICEKLSHEICGFAIGISGQRCLIETSVSKDGKVEYQCRTSDVVVEQMFNHIESDSCVTACGVDRKSVGISSDTLLEPGFASKLCSPACYNFCPNIVDLYSNLAEGEGSYLPDICAAQRSNPHRSMMDIMSSREAPGPISGPTSFVPGSGPASGPISSAPAPGPVSASDPVSSPISSAPAPGPVSASDPVSSPISSAPAPGPVSASDPVSSPISSAPAPGPVSASNPVSSPISSAPASGDDSDYGDEFSN